MLWLGDGEGSRVVSRVVVTGVGCGGACSDGKDRINLKLFKRRESHSRAFVAMNSCDLDQVLNRSSVSSICKNHSNTALV